MGRLLAFIDILAIIILKTPNIYKMSSKQKNTISANIRRLPTSLLVAIPSILVVIITLLVSLYIVYQYTSPTTKTPVDFAGFYGGVFGPLATISGFIFLYLAYTSQKATTDLALLNKLYADLLEDINSLQYTDRGRGINRFFRKEVTFKGIDALYHFNTNDTDNSVLNHLNLIIVSFKQLLQVLEKSTFSDGSTKKVFKDKVCLLYYAKVIWPVLDGVYKAKNELLVRDSSWGNAELLFFEFEKLTASTIEYLDEKQLILKTAFPKPAAMTQKQREGLPGIMVRSYASPSDWAKNEKQYAEKHFTLRTPWRTSVGEKIFKPILPAFAYNWLKVHTRFDLLMHL